MDITDVIYEDLKHAYKTIAEMQLESFDRKCIKEVLKNG